MASFFLFASLSFWPTHYSLVLSLNTEKTKHEIFEHLTKDDDHHKLCEKWEAQMCVIMAYRTSCIAYHEWEISSHTWCLIYEVFDDWISTYVCSFPYIVHSHSQTLWSIWIIMSVTWPNSNRIYFFFEFSMIPK